MLVHWLLDVLLLSPPKDFQSSASQCCTFPPQDSPFTTFNDRRREKKTFNVMHEMKKWVFPKIGVPQNGWFIKENPIKMDEFGGTTIFGNTQMECLNQFVKKSIFFKSKLRSSPPGVWRSHNSPGWFIQILIMVCYNPLYTLIQPEVLFFFHGSYVIFVCLGFFLKPAVAFKIVLKVTVSQSAKPKGLPVL